MHILDEKVVYRNGSCSYVRRWVSGHVTVPGTDCRYIMGKTGPETEITFRVIKPIGLLYVFQAEPAQPAAA